MYDWVTESLKESGTIVSANRRLSRLLKSEYNERQRQSGVLAWDSPRIFAWQDWLVATSNSARSLENLPTRLNGYQSQILWEKCWSKELGDDARISSLVKLARDAWQRMADWQVTISDVARAAKTPEEQAFARVAGRYIALLQRNQMIDEAGLGAQLLDLIESNGVAVTGPHTFVGFDRQRPVARAIEAAMRASGVDVCAAPDASQSDDVSLMTFDSEAAEQRAAGAWARDRIEENPGARVAIVANDLQNYADSIGRNVREGATPGWQYGSHSLRDAVNVSFGRRLNEYPAIGIALIALRWLIHDIRTAELSLLFRSPLLGGADVSRRSQIELRLRKVPDRNWSPSMITSEFRSNDAGNDNSETSDDWSSRLAALSKRRREVPGKATPSEWVVFIDDSLKSLGWPGEGSLDSAEFQLINRWRELLNDFARLTLVSPTMSANAALARIELLATDTVFQPESGNASIQLIGPLEAAGSEFDALWISGVTSTNWPPTGSRSMLISRRLQESRGMPDGTPADTLHYAEQILSRLLQSASTTVCSFSRYADDSEQTPSSLLGPSVNESVAIRKDPGWNAAELLKSAEVEELVDRIPRISAGEKLSGGAAAIQWQMTDPVSALLRSRMSANPISPQAVGVPPLLRGNLLHDALYKLYIDLPTSAMIRTWAGADFEAQIATAVDFAFSRHERNTDSTLRHLLALERVRVAALLKRFVAIDGDRGDFNVTSVEGKFEFVSGHIRLPLRFDRLDTTSDNGIAILDYKTGAKKRLLNRQNDAQDIQLFVYAFAIEAPVSSLALVNIDSREITFEGAGHGYTELEQWPELLQNIKLQIDTACDEMQAGDARINIEQGVAAARPLNLLTRYTEIVRDRR